MSTKLIYGFAALSEATGLPLRTLQTLAKQRRIPFLRIGYRTTLFDADKVLAALERFEVKAVEMPPPPPRPPRKKWTRRSGLPDWTLRPDLIDLAREAFDAKEQELEQTRTSEAILDKDRVRRVRYLTQESIVSLCDLIHESFSSQAVV